MSTDPGLTTDEFRRRTGLEGLGEGKVPGATPVWMIIRVSREIARAHMANTEAQKYEFTSQPQQSAILRKMTSRGYIHTFTDREQNRLVDQAEFLARYHHAHLDLTGCRDVIEVGCGVGAQMRIVLRNWPDVTLTGVDTSSSQLSRAADNLRDQIAAGRASLVLGSGEALAFADASFDAAIVFWVFEHIADPIGILSQLYRILEPGAPVFITEVFDSAVYTYPRCPNISAYFAAFVALQRELGGDPDAAMRIPGLASQAGFTDIIVRDVSPMLDARMPDKGDRSRFLAYFESLLLSGSDELLARRKVDSALIDGVKEDFASLAKDPDAVFHYGAKLTTARKSR